MPSKTKVHRIFNAIWRGLFFACFEFKIGVFQQTVVRARCYILKCNRSIAEE